MASRSTRIPVLPELHTEHQTCTRLKCSARELATKPTHWLYQHVRSNHLPHLKPHCNLLWFENAGLRCVCVYMRCHNIKSVSYYGLKWNHKNTECAVQPRDLVPRAKCGVNGHACSVWQHITWIHDLHRQTGVKLIWTGKWRAQLCCTHTTAQCGKLQKCFFCIHLVWFVLLIYCQGGVCFPILYKNIK